MKRLTCGLLAVALGAAGCLNFTGSVADLAPPPAPAAPAPPPVLPGPVSSEKDAEAKVKQLNEELHWAEAAPPEPAPAPPAPPAPPPAAKPKP
jgi:5'-nucleotidase